MQTAIEMPTTEQAPSLEQELIAAIREMPEDRAREVLDFALFLQARIAAEDAKWDAAFAATPESKFAEMAARVRAQVAAGEAKPMFDAVGELARP